MPPPPTSIVRTSHQDKAANEATIQATAEMENCMAHVTPKISTAILGQQQSLNPTNDIVTSVSGLPVGRFASVLRLLRQRVLISRLPTPAARVLLTKTESIFLDRRVIPRPSHFASQETTAPNRRKRYVQHSSKRYTYSNSSCPILHHQVSNLPLHHILLYPLDHRPPPSHLHPSSLLSKTTMQGVVDRMAALVALLPDK